jgi:hypothetical protein
MLSETACLVIRIAPLQRHMLGIPVLSPTYLDQPPYKPAVPMTLLVHSPRDTAVFSFYRYHHFIL